MTGLKCAVWIAVFTASMVTCAQDKPEQTGIETGGTLHRTILALDNAVFDAFNRCSEQGQLDKHASYFDPQIEFYHDNGGVTWNRDDMIASTRKYVCGNFSRELVVESFKVFPVKDFGAISQGIHRFCQFASGECEGLAEFTMVWHLQGDKWQITRVLSYGHRPAE